MEPMEIKPSLKVDDGLHKGVITEVLERTTPQQYKYIDVVIDFEEGKTIKASYPAFLSTESKLGNLLARFGADISTPNTFVNVEEVLVGKACQFLTMNKPVDGKIYPNVVSDSVRLA